MLEDAVAKAGRLVADLERDAAAMKPPAGGCSSVISNVSMVEGERAIGAALDCARRLLEALHESADNQAKS